MHLPPKTTLLHHSLHLIHYSQYGHGSITPNYIEYTLSYAPYKEGELQRAKKVVCRVAPKWSVSVVFFDTGLSQTPQSYFNVISKAIEEASMEINYACSLLLNAY